MAIITVSFSNGFVGDYSKNNEAINANYLTTYGWSNFQFRQSSDNGQFGGSQGNDYSGTILITDANGVQHAIDGVINWRAPSGSVSTIVFYATGASQTLATSSGTYLIDPFSGANGDPRTFIGLTFNGQTLNISGGQVNGNAATSGLLPSLNTYLAAQPQLTVGDVVVDEGAGIATVTVTMSKVSSDTVTVKYSSADGSASAGSDYTSTSGTLTFNPGETSKTFQVSILNDTALESAENFSITLSDGRFAAITDNSATVQITDNDSVAVTVSSVLAEDAANTGATPTDSTVTEGASLLYSVGLSAAGGSATEFSLAIGGSSGASDYGTFSFSNGVAWKSGNPATGIIVVPAGVASFTITVPTSDDALIESTESLTLIVGGVAASGSITDNDSQSVSSVLAEDAANTGANP
ncbi:Calx-beta domain-containing protein, partial [Massilia sp. YIM B04103]|uniref:Calx-beta domain-containing protein n=1 Tax=Massilia sp. YIM B04103 TaxID=2963106 RepID=UPI00272E39B7